MSGSYFDDVLRDPRRYGIENTTDKVGRRGPVRRRRDAICTANRTGPLSWDIAPDGHFLIISQTSTDASITAVFNWRAGASN